MFFIQFFQYFLIDKITAFFEQRRRDHIISVEAFLSGDPFKPMRKEGRDYHRVAGFQQVFRSVYFVINAAFLYIKTFVKLVRVYVFVVA